MVLNRYLTNHFLKNMVIKKKNKIVLIEIISIIFYISSGLLPYKIHAYFGTYKIGFNLISFHLIITSILFLFSIFSIYYEKYLGAILLNFLGCSIVGVILITDLVLISSPEYLSIGFYFAYFPWLSFCIVSMYLFKSGIKFPQCNLYKTLNEDELDRFFKFKRVYLFSLLLFYILTTFPFVLTSSYGGIFVTGVYFYIIGGGWIGFALLVIGYINLSKYQIQKSTLIGLIGNIITGLDLIMISISWPLEQLTVAYLISILVWILIVYINISQLFFLFRKHGFPQNQILKLHRNKSGVYLLKWVIIFYVICTIGFITTTLFPYSPYSPAYDLSKIGLYYLWMGGWQGLILILLSIFFLYFTKIRISYTLGIFGSILLGTNFIIVHNLIFVDDQQTFFINFYMSVSLLAILFLTNIFLLLFHLKYKDFLEREKKFTNI